MIQIYKIEDEADLKNAFALRHSVFVIEQGVNPQLEHDQFELECEHFLAREGNAIMGTARLRKTESGIKLERFAIASLFRGNGIGKLLGEFIIRYVEESWNLGPDSRTGIFQNSHFSKDINLLFYLNAQVQVIPFYEKLGFKAIGEEFSEAGILHKKMIRRV